MQFWLVETIFRCHVFDTVYRFNGTLRNELLNRKIFDSLFEAKVLVERRRKEYNQIRPHSSLGYRPPAPEAIYPKIQQFDKSFVN